MFPIEKSDSRLKKQYFAHMNRVILLLCIVLVGCGVQRLDRAYLEYDVTIEKEGQPLSEEVLGKRAPNMRVTITGDTAFANYFYGKTMLSSIVVEDEKGWLIMKMDKDRYTTEMTRQEVELFLGLEEANWQLSTQKGKQNCGSYRCKKATGITPDSMKVEVAFTPKWQLKNQQYQYAFPQLNGVPVNFTVQQNDLTYTYTLKSLETEVKPLRILIPQQYQQLSFEEFMALDYH